MMCAIWNASFCQDDKNKRAIVQSRLIQILKKSLVLFFFVKCFLVLIFNVFGELKTRFLRHRSLYLYNEYRKYFRCLEYYYRDVMCKILCSSFALGVYNNRAIVPNPNVGNRNFCTSLFSVSFCSFSAIRWPEKEISGYRCLCINNEYNK